MTPLRCILVALALSSLAPAQSSFEVISIKRHDLQNQAYMHPTCENKRFRATAEVIPELLMWAYDLRLDQYFALESVIPSWARTTAYDIEAVAKDPMTPSQCRQFARQMLVDRFDLKFHWKILKNAPRYELTVSPKGHKLIPVTPADTGCGVHISTDGREVPCNRYQWPLAIKRAMTMTELAKQLSIHTHDRPIQDLTGLTGEYKLTLSFTTRTDNLDYPPLERALQDQLGLILRPTKGDVDLLVIDRIDQPSAN